MHDRLDLGRRLTILTPLLALVAGPMLSGCGIEADVAQIETLEMERKGAALGMDPKASVTLERANKEFYENRPTDELFDKVVEATHHSNVETRLTAFTTFAPLRGTSFHERGLREIERMKTDSAPEIRDQYVWVCYLAEHPRWRQICEKALGSPRPEEKRLAESALSRGPRTPKRAKY